MNILGVRIDNLSKSEALQKTSSFLIDPGFAKATPGKLLQQYKIFTPNPEMLVDAQKDEYFRGVLNSGDLNVCDGVGLWLVMSLRAKRSNPPEIKIASSLSAPRNDTRYPGTDLMQDICALAEKEGKTVYLLGSGSDEVVEKTADVLKTKFPNLKISGFHPGLKLANLSPPQRDPVFAAGPTCKLTYDTEKNDDLLHDIIMKAPDILFVAFGHGKQEKWIYENLKHLPSVKIAMGVGGAFDYISGKTKRAPLFLRQIGLEWMYRLVREPKRIGRIWKATFIFIILFFKTRSPRTR